MTVSPKPSIWNRQSAAGIALLAASVAMILFNGSTALNKFQIEQHLIRFANYISAQATASNKEGQFSYGEVKLEGWGYDKRGVIDNVSLTISEREILDTQRWLISTARILVLPTTSRQGGLNFLLPGPINVIKNSQLKSSVSFATPVKYSYLDGLGKDGRVVTHLVQLPGEIHFDPPQVAGDVVQPKGRLMMRWDNHPLVQIKTWPDTGQRDITYAFNNVSISEDEGLLAGVASVSAHYSETTGADKQSKGRYEWTASDIMLGDDKKSSGPYTVHAELQSSGDSPMLDLRTLTPRFGHVAMTIDTLEMRAANFKLSAQGKISTAEGDPLPFGQISLTIDNAGNLLANSLVPESLRSALTAALEKVTGKPVEAETDLSLPLSRAENSMLYVGDTTFEVLAALILKDVLQSTLPLSFSPPSDGEPNLSVPPGEAEPAEVEKKE